MSVPRWPSARACSTASLSIGSERGILGADEHDPVPGPHCSGRQRHALEQQLGALLHQVLVDVGARVALVAVDHDRLVGARRLGRELPLAARREPGAAAPADLGFLDLGEELFGAQLAERALESGPVAPAQQHGLLEHGRALRLRCLAQLARHRPLGSALTGVHQPTLAHGGAGVAEAQADRMAQGDLLVVRALAQAQPETLLHLAHVVTEVTRPAGGARADAHMTPAARLQQVVVEGRDPVDRGLGQTRDRGGHAPVLVHDLAALVDRLLEHGQGRGRCLSLARAEHLDQIERHAPNASYDLFAQIGTPGRRAERSGPSAQAATGSTFTPVSRSDTSHSRRARASSRAVEVGLTRTGQPRNSPKPSGPM